MTPEPLSTLLGLPRGSQCQVLRLGSRPGYSFSANAQLVDSISGDTIT